MPRVTSEGLSYTKDDYYWWFAVVAGANTLAAIVGGLVFLAVYTIAGQGHIVLSGAAAVVVGMMASAKLVQMTARDSP